MVVIATAAILAIGSTATNMAMAHHDHHESGSSSGGGSNDPQSTCGFAQTLGSDGLCHYSLDGAINECAHNLPECITLGKIVLGGF
jgi:hypothetical protein